jgi:chemotaxis protein MotB
MRRRHNGAHANHERWLISYADFITLLFALFVVLFASTQADKEKVKQLSASVRDALQHGQLSSAVSMMLGRDKYENSRPPRNPDRVEHSENLPPKSAPQGSAPADLAKSLAALHQSLAVELQAGKLGLKLERRGLIVSFREAAFFASGDDAVNPAGLPTIAKVADEVRRLPNPLRIEGHTDSVPIHNGRFRSNWELSAARAIAVMELLRQRFGIPEERMSVGGYAENAPTDTNETATGRAHNRRVDLVVLSAEGEISEPKPAAAAKAQP